MVTSSGFDRGFGCRVPNLEFAGMLVGSLRCGSGSLGHRGVACNDPSVDVHPAWVGRVRWQRGWYGSWCAVGAGRRGSHTGPGLLARERRPRRHGAIIHVGGHYRMHFLLLGCWHVAGCHVHHRAF